MRIDIVQCPKTWKASSLLTFRSHSTE